MYCMLTLLTSSTITKSTILNGLTPGCRRPLLESIMRISRWRAEKRPKNERVCGSKTARRNLVRKSLLASFGRTADNGTRPTSNALLTKTIPRADPFKTGKCSGTARANCPKTYQKRGRLRTENGASESSKKKHSFGTPTDKAGRAKKQANAEENGSQSGPLQNRETQRHGARKMPKNAPKTRPAADRKRGV